MIVKKSSTREYYIFFHHDMIIFSKGCLKWRRIKQVRFFDAIYYYNLPFYLVNPFSENFSMVINSRREEEAEENRKKINYKNF